MASMVLKNKGNEKEHTLKERVALGCCLLVVLVWKRTCHSSSSGWRNTTHYAKDRSARIHSSITWKAYNWPYSLLSCDFMTLLVMAGSFMANQDASAKKSSHCLERRSPRFAWTR
eukprot:1147737-Pelagomonas_calceolata.AAC.2